MRVTLTLGLAASGALVFGPAPFVSIPLLWSGFLLHRAAVDRHRVRKLVCINLAGMLLLFGLAEGVLRLRPALELSGSLTEGYFRGHESLGYAPVAENRATALRSFDGELLYEVVYTIDQNGLRVSPPFVDAAGEECLLFFGGSFTFGEGVNDDEAMPYRVGLKTAGRFRVYNFAFHGYGAHQMLANLDDGLVAGTIDCAPRRAIYLAHPDHVARAAGYAPWDTHGPRYLLEPGGRVAYAGHFDDGLAFYGRGLLTLLGQSKLLAPLVALRQPDAEASEALFVGVVAAAREQVEAQYPGAEFHLILWDDESSSLSRRLASAGLRLHLVDAIVPAAERSGPRFTIPRDGHPTAELHDRVADYVARQIVAPVLGGGGAAPARR